MTTSNVASATRYATAVVTVLLAMPCASCAKLVAIEKIDTVVLATHSSHHTTMGLRSQLSRSSTAASSRTKTGAPTRLTSGHQASRAQRPHAIGDLGALIPNAAARLAISQFVKTIAAATP